jgi:hypothetical protein
MQDATPGDLVLAAGRSKPLEVVRTGETDEGLRFLLVEGPSGGEYRIRERYDATGAPKYTSKMGRANDLHIVEERLDRDPADIAAQQELSEAEYERLVERLVERSIDVFARLDYESYHDAVEEVVEEWADEVSYWEWAEWEGAWVDGTSETIFLSVLEHAGRWPEIDARGVSQTPRNQAMLVLTDEVVAAGRPEAERTLIRSQSTYDDTVEKLAHYALDRFRSKGYDSARIAVRDTVGNFIDTHTETVHDAIITYGEQPSFEDDLYSGYSEEEMKRERAYDILDIAVWERVRQMQREVDEHDPTRRGLTYRDYDDLVDALMEEALRQHHGSRPLRSVVVEVVDDWADAVDAEVWEGHRFELWAPGDRSDIFASAAMHGSVDPVTFNPFSQNRERKLAEQVLVADVFKRAERVKDEEESAPPVPATEYLQEELGLDVSYDDILREESEDLGEFLIRGIESLEGNELGWTFVDEAVAAGALVPQMTNEWVLIDYGIVRSDDDTRRLAWFHRDTGDVLTVRGTVDGDPTEGAYETNDDFTVSRWYYRVPDRDHLLTDVPASRALRFVYDYTGAASSDVKVVEDMRGERWVVDTVTDDDINTGGVLDALVPNISLPGPDLTETDIYNIAEDRLYGASRWLLRWSGPLGRLGKFAVVKMTPYLSARYLSNLRIEPQVSSRHGPGLRGSYIYGRNEDSWWTAKVDANFNIKPSAIRQTAAQFVPQGDGPGVVDAEQRGRVVEGLSGAKRLFDDIGLNWKELWVPLTPENLAVSDAELPPNIQSVDDLYDIDEADAEQTAKKLNRGLTTDDSGLSYTEVLKFRKFVVDNDVALDSLLTTTGKSALWHSIGNNPRSTFTREALSEIFGISVADIGGFGQRLAGATEEEYALAESDVTVRPDEGLQEALKRQKLELTAQAASANWERYAETLEGEQRDEALERAEKFSRGAAAFYDAEDPDLYEDDADAEDFNAAWESLEDWQRDSIEAVTTPQYDGELTWRDLEDAPFPLSRLFFRALDARSLTNAAKTLNLDRLFSFDGRDHFDYRPWHSPPKYREWHRARYGTDPGTGTDEAEVARWAKFQQEMAPEDAPTPDEIMGTSAVADEQRLGAITDDPDDLGDWNNARHFQEEFGEAFEDVAARFEDGSPDAADRAADTADEE